MRTNKSKVNQNKKKHNFDEIYQGIMFLSSFGYIIALNIVVILHALIDLPEKAVYGTLFIGGPAMLIFLIAIGILWWNSPLDD